MLGRTYDNQICSIARTLEIVGERWTLLIVRDALLGMRRFDEFRESLGVARNVLSDRLARLVDAGILDRVRYQEHPERYEYRLTAKGRELSVALISLMHWGDKHLAGESGPPRLTRHAECGGEVVTQFACTGCGEPVAPGSLDVRLNPAAIPS